MHVYERVRAYVEERGLEPGAVASTAGIPRAWFAAMLAGKRRMYAEDLRAICLALGVSADEMIAYGEPCERMN